MAGLMDQKKQESIRLEEQKKILNEISKRKIKNLIHFTDIRNLESILTHGILSRDYLEKNNIISEINDIERREGRKDCISFSIEYPNEFFMARHKHKKFCILILDIKQVIINHNSQIYFLYHNAAIKEFRHHLSINNYYLTTYDAFIKMFQENNPDTRHQYTRTEKNIPIFLPTNPQAEVLICGNLSNNYIDKIVFASEFELSCFKQNLKNGEIINNFDFICNNIYFKKRDCIHWEER